MVYNALLDFTYDLHVASENPAKLLAVKDGFKEQGFSVANVFSYKVQPTVPRFNPFNDEIEIDACDRAMKLFSSLYSSSFFIDRKNHFFIVSLESGIKYDQTKRDDQNEGNSLFCYTGACIIDSMSTVVYAEPEEPDFDVAPFFTLEELAREELGTLIDKHTGEEDSKRQTSATNLLEGTKGRPFYCQRSIENVLAEYESLFKLT